MDVKELVARLRSLVENARSMPMSTSAVVNRAEVLEVVSQLEAALPAAFAGQQEVVSERAAVVADGHEESQRIVAAAEQERDRLVAESEVLRRAQEEAERERAEARAEAAELRRETDEYVDGRLATFEIALTKTLQAVARGRSRLHVRSHFDALGDSGDDGAGVVDDGVIDPH